MNLSSFYNFELDSNQFLISIDWSFNLLYLKNYKLHQQIYIDGSLELILEGISYPLGSEQDFGCTLDLIDFLGRSFEGPIIQNNTVNILKNKDILVINSNELGLHNIIINVGGGEALHNVKNSIINDFDKLSKNIDYLTKLLT